MNLLTRSDDEPPISGTAAVNENSHCPLLNIALATVVDAVIGTDPQDHITFFNPAAESMTGWRSSEALGKPLTQVFFLIDQENDKVIDSPLDGEAWPCADVRSDPCGRGQPKGPSRRNRVHRGSHACDAHGRVCGSVDRIPVRAAKRRRSPTNPPTSRSGKRGSLVRGKGAGEVTLDSIGDAVDQHELQRPGGLSEHRRRKNDRIGQADASGRAVGEGMSLVDSIAHETIPCPTAQAVIENRRISLEAVCVLIGATGRDRGRNLAAPIHDRNGGVIGAVMVAHDVTAARELSMKLARLALARQPDRSAQSGLVQRSARLKPRQCPANGWISGVALRQLDRFKHIDDTFGAAPSATSCCRPWHGDCRAALRSTDTGEPAGRRRNVVLLSDTSISRMP